jgi:hypothetical protein
MRRRRIAMNRIPWLIAFTTVAAVAFAADPTPLDKYEVLIGEDFAGSGFVIKHGDTYWGVCSLHQFEGKSPGQFERLEGEPVKLDPAKAVKQKDVQVLPVHAPAADLQFLPYHPDFQLAAGDELVVLGPAGDVVPAKLTARGLNRKYRSSAGPATLEARTDEPFVAAGGSGAPIILKRTGAVIGVLLTADDGRKARTVGFETLCFAHQKR